MSCQSWKAITLQQMPGLSTGVCPWTRLPQAGSTDINALGTAMDAELNGCRFIGFPLELRWSHPRAFICWVKAVPQQLQGASRKGQPNVNVNTHTHRGVIKERKKDLQGWMIVFDGGSEQYSLSNDSLVCQSNVLVSSPSRSLSDLWILIMAISETPLVSGNRDPDWY